MRNPRGVVLDPGELEWRFVRASGPGGQNVNKVSSAVQLRFNLAGSKVLTPEAKARLARLAGSRLSDEGILVIDARRFRSQARNRQDAFERLLELIATAQSSPRKRVATQPTAASRERRLQSKKAAATKKALRRRVRGTE